MRSNLASDCNQEPVQSPRLVLASTNMASNSASQILYEHMAHNGCKELQLSEDMEMIKTNMNYMNLNASSSDQVIGRQNGMGESNLILNKQTNDIYFNRVVNEVLFLILLVLKQPLLRTELTSFIRPPP
jgi:hypothetical protein